MNDPSGSITPSFPSATHVQLRVITVQFFASIGYRHKYLTQLRWGPCSKLQIRAPQRSPEHIMTVSVHQTNTNKIKPKTIKGLCNEWGEPTAEITKCPDEFKRSSVGAHRSWISKSHDNAPIVTHYLVVPYSDFHTAFLRRLCKQSEKILIFLAGKIHLPVHNCGYMRH